LAAFAHAADVPKSEWPPYVTLNRSVEMPAMAENGQMRMAKLAEGTMVQLIQVDGDRVEVLHQGLTIRLPAAITDLPKRAQAPKPEVASASQPVRPAAPAVPSAVPPPAQPAAKAAEPTPTPAQPAPDTKTFIESTMSGETFKAAGLDKLSPTQLQVLDGWFLDIVLTSKRSGATLTQNDLSLTAPGKKSSVERALLVKNFNGEKVLIQRTNGEKWMLRAKTWCRWSWRYEGRQVCLVFSPTTSQLINDYGETYDFLTDKQVQ
jgi:biotin carboxyl carrier protein